MSNRVKPNFLPFISANGRSSDPSDYRVVDRQTGNPIFDSILWADANLGVYARLVKDEQGHYQKDPSGVGALRELVHAEFDIVLAEKVCV